MSVVVVSINLDNSSSVLQKVTIFSKSSRLVNLHSAIRSHPPYIGVA
jgi:hypothetical protein